MSNEVQVVVTIPAADLEAAYQFAEENDVRMDCAISILATGKEGIIRAASHPPALSRRDKLRSNISRVMYGKDGAFPLDVAVNLELLFNELWTRAKPKLEQAHALGYRPASCWRLSPTFDAT